MMHKGGQNKYPPPDLRYILVPRKFKTIIQGDGFDSGFERRQMLNRCSRQQVGSFARQANNDRIQRLTLNHRQQNALATLADDRIAFPVTNSATPVNDRRALINTTLFLIFPRRSDSCHSACDRALTLPEDAYTNRHRWPCLRKSTGKSFVVQSIRLCAFSGNRQPASDSGS